MALPTPGYSWVKIGTSGGSTLWIGGQEPAAVDCVLNDKWLNLADGIIYLFDSTRWAMPSTPADIAALQALVGQAMDGITTLSSGLAATDRNLQTNQQTDITQDGKIGGLLAANTATSSDLANLAARVTALEAGSPPAVPQAPTDLVVTAAGETTMALSWSAPVSGPAVTDYQVQYALVTAGAVGAFQAGPAPDAATTATVTGLTSGLTYAFHVYARNAAGPGPISNEVREATTTAFTPSPARSSVPPLEALIMDDGRSVTISAPDATGGHAMLDGVQMGYNTYIIKLYKDDNGNIWHESNDPYFAANNYPGGVGWYFVPANTVDGSDWSAGSDPTGTVIPPGTNPTKEAIINWIAGLAGNHVIVGQYEGDLYGDPTPSDNFAALTGKRVALKGYSYWPFWADYALAADYSAANAAAIAHWNAGGLVMLNQGYPSPTNGGLWSGTCTPSEVIRPGSAQYNLMHTYYDQEIAGLLELKAAGVIPIYRSYPENRWSFWYGFASGNAWDDATWITMWQQHYDYLVAAGCDHLIWLQSQCLWLNDTTHNTYPGDAYVDMIGEDVYSSTPTEYAAWYGTEVVQHPNIPWCMAEFGSGGPATNQIDYNFDYRVLINSIKNSMPKTTFFQSWHAGWSIANMQHVPEAMADSYVLTLENLGRPDGVVPPTGSTTWWDNPGGDGSYAKLPVQTGLIGLWERSGARVNALRIGSGAINIGVPGATNWCPPWVTGFATDPLVTITDQFGHSIEVRMPVGTTSENMAVGDNSLGGIDSTQPYLMYTMNNAFINAPLNGATSGSIHSGAGNYINCWFLGVFDATGPIMMDAVTGNHWQSMDNTFGMITDRDLTAARLDPNWTIQHSLYCHLDPTQASAAFVWPCAAADLSCSGPIPEGSLIGIPADVSMPGGLSRGAQLLWKNLQQFGWMVYNVGGSGTIGTRIFLIDQVNNTAMANEIRAGMASVVPHLCVYSGSTSVNNMKGMVGGVRSDAFPAPPLLDYSPTGGFKVLPSTFGAWYMVNSAGTGASIAYNTIW